MFKMIHYLHVIIDSNIPKTKLCSQDNAAYFLFVLTPLGNFSVKKFYYRDEIRMIHVRTYTCTVTDRNVLLILNHRTM